MTNLRSWFDARSLREKRLLIVMIALAVITLIWAAVIRPIGDGLSSTRERYADAVVRFGATETRVEALQAAQRARPQPIPGTLADAVRLAADNAGFTLASLDQTGQSQVRIGIQSARPAALAGWLARLETAGVLVDQATLTDNGDRTVGVTLVLEARAP